MKSTNPSKRTQSSKQTASDAEDRSHAPSQNVSEGNDQPKGRHAAVANSRSGVVRATEGLVRLELQRRRRALLRWFVVVCVVLGIAYGLHMALSAWLGIDPITHLWELIRIRLPISVETT